MAYTLPTLTLAMDNAFTETWYEVKKEAADNVTQATVVWALLKQKGRFTPQRGGRFINRTIKYALPTPIEVVKGDVMGEGETETETAASWRFRFLSQHIQRSAFDDRENAGRYQIKPYVAKRLNEATEALGQAYEAKLLNAIVTDESGKSIQGLNDMIPPLASRATGTYGLINRPGGFNSGTAGAIEDATTGNTFWSPRYMQFRSPIDVNMVSDMQAMFNYVGNNISNPDIILTTQELYQTFEEFGMDAIQTTTNSSMLNLGFTTLMYKGATLTWTSNMTAGNMLFINSKKMEVVYDPGMWFDMSEWKPIPRQAERLAHILCAMDIISDELRRHGRLYT